jgi:hypothetical protein
VSGAITPPGSIVAGTTVRQTLPYGDRPFVDLATGTLTQDAHQWIQRLAAGFGTTVQNVGTVVTATNQLSENITEVNEQLTTINDEIQNITTQVIQIKGDPQFPPTAMAPQPTNPPVPSVAPPPLYPDQPRAVPFLVGVGLGFFFGVMPA